MKYFKQDKYQDNNENFSVSNKCVCSTLVAKAVWDCLLLLSLRTFEHNGNDTKTVT